MRIHVISWIFQLDDYFIALGIVLLFLSMSLLYGWLITRSRWRDRLKALCWANSDLIMLLSLLFSLMIGFLASEIETRNEKATSAVSAEANAFQSLASILAASPPADGLLRQPTAEYLNEVLKAEFSGERRQIASSNAQAKLSHLFGKAIAFSATHGGVDATPPLILELIIKASEARALRFSLMRAGVNELKWWLVFFLLLALQLSIVMVYSNEPQKMLAVLLFVSIAGGATVSAAALQEDPFTPPRMVSAQPLEMALASLPSGPQSYKMERIK